MDEDPKNLKSKRSRGRPPKSFEERKIAVTIHLSLNQIVILKQLTKMHGLNKSRVIGKLLDECYVDYDLDVGAITCLGRVEGAYKARITHFKNKAQHFSKRDQAPVYVIKGCTKRPSWIDPDLMVKVAPRGTSLYQDVWVVSEKGLCKMPLWGRDLKVFGSPEEFIENIELNPSFVSKLLAERIKLNEFEIIEQDREAVKLNAEKLKHLLYNTLSQK